ncbi:MAG: spermidine/putrescine ABC transporter substrate-binding protein [Clostridia bacterium]|nr:spermidine/putrescine ABC transporter substrate-binding protein [Clostridia bacterium]
MKKRLLPLLLATMLLLTALAATGCGADGRETVLLYTWGEYLDEAAVVPAFEEAYPQYRLKVKTFEDNEKMYPMLENNAYDVIVPSDYMALRLIREDRLLPLDTAALPNIVNNDPMLESIVFDPDPAMDEKLFDYAVPYMYCTVGLMYNKDEVPAPASDDPQDVWAPLFDTKYENRIGMYDSMRESIGAALNYLGCGLNTLDAGELAKAEDLLLDQRTNVRPLVGIDDLKDKFVSGELVAGIAWSGDHVVCQARLGDAGKDPEMLQYALPAGSNISIDLMCIPKNAKNVPGALALIDFLCRPDIALVNCEYVGYSTPNLPAREELDESIRENPAYYPGEDLMKTLQPYFSSEEIDSTYDALWTKYLSTN